MSEITFITSNQQKLKELKLILQNDNIRAQKIDLIELQGSPQYISIEKCKYAATLLNDNTVLVEDTSLCFEALGGLPGPYIKHFYDNIGNEGLFKLLHSFPNKRAYASCIFALKQPGKEVQLFEGVVHGTIVEPAGGTNGFGWDDIFKPDNCNLTFSEMNNDDKHKISHRKLALDKLSLYLQKSSPIS